MTELLDQHLNSVFSLLPEQHARDAKRTLLHRYKTNLQANCFELKWADFELDGTFIRGGISDMLDLSTQMLRGQQDDGDIAALSRTVAEEKIGAGDVRWLAEGKVMQWFVPHRPLDANKVRAPVLRGMSITESIVGEILEMFNPQAKLSAEEKRVVFQTVAGVELRQAATDDDVSYETKRAHIKTASEKLQISGQKELVRTVLGQMVHLLSISGSEISHAEIAEAMVARFLANDVRLVVKRAANGRLLRYFECGPDDGVPVVMVHGMMFPISLYGLSDHLEREGIQLIIPIRPGYLEARSISSILDQTGLITSGIDDTIAIIDTVLGGKAIVLGNSLGAVVAIRLARLYPDRVSQLILLSANLTQTAYSEEGFAGHFYDGMRALTDVPELFKLANLEFRKYYANTSTCRDILTRHFGASIADIDVLEGKYSNVPAYSIFSETYQTSIAGISEDFGFVMTRWQDEVKLLEHPVTFLHGAADPLTDISQFDPLLELAQDVRIVPIEGAGHFAGVSHANFVWKKSPRTRTPAISYPKRVNAVYCCCSWQNGLKPEVLLAFD